VSEDRDIFPCIWCETDRRYALPHGLDVEFLLLLRDIVERYLTIPELDDILIAREVISSDS
jgi:hypothetical protein